VWNCTSSDPPITKVYDSTNGRWLDHHARYYRTLNYGYKTQGDIKTINGFISIQDDNSGPYSGNVFLYFKANGLWWGVKNS